MDLIRKIVNSKPVERFKRFLVLKTGIYLRLKRLNPSISEPLRTVKLLNHFGVDKVLDVGANTGQFAESLIDFGFKGKIVSFEPVESAHEMVTRRAGKYPQWIVADRMAIGNKDGKAVMNVSDSTDFSSLKEIKAEYVKKKGAARVVKKEEVVLNRLDSLKGRFFTDEETIFLKIDTQGFEKEVIEGAPELMKKLKGIMIETPLVTALETYKGVELNIFDYFKMFEGMGFKIVSVASLHADKESGFMNEADCIFMRFRPENNNQDE